MGLQGTRETCHLGLVSVEKVTVSLRRTLSAFLLGSSEPRAVSVFACRLSTGTHVVRVRVHM